MNNIENKLIEIFCHVVDFNKVFIKELQTHQLTTGSRKRIKPACMSESEIIIIIYFHLMRYRDFKHYYLFHVCKHMNNEFPHLVSYNRFIELSHTVLLPLVVYLRTQCSGKCTGITFIDSTPMKACHIKRALVETVCDELKNNLPDGSQVCQIEHTRHRSQEGFIINLIPGLIAYCYLPKKPSLNLEIVDLSMALTF